MSNLAFSGKLLAIAITPSPAGEMHGVETIEAVAHLGLTGDRYALQTGTFQGKPGEEPKDITLIESEALEAALRDHKTTITHLMTRRNLLTVGVPLNHLVGKTFAVGDVLIRGIELCEPCRHLQKLTCKEILRPLVHRGGLRAEIVRGGTLKVGDVVRSQASERGT
jgi:MOSC domain-containing protein YiiM